MKTRNMTTCSLLRRLSAAAAALVISLSMTQKASAEGTNYPATILADNPSVYYQFEETSGLTAFNSATNSVTSNTWNATIYPNGESTSPDLGLPGIDTNSFLFTLPGAASDYGYVDIPEGMPITPLTTNGAAAAFSAELWVQPNAYPANWSVPIVQGINNGTIADGWNIYVSGPGAGNPAGQSYFYLDMRPGVFSGFPDFLISFGEWYHLVLSYDGNNAVFYINNVAHNISVGGTNGYAVDTTQDALIGSGAPIGWLPFIGGVDEVAFYTNALTAEQVSNHYTVGTNSFRPAFLPAGILTDLSSETNYSGLPVTFSITASGTPPLTYTWYSNSVPVGPNADALTFTAQYPGNNGAQISVVISNAFGPPVTSSVVSLTVLTNLNVISPPGSITRNVGSHAAFHVTANGAVPITYQWSISSDGGNTFTSISGATNETYWLTNVQLSQSGNMYSVLVANPFGNSGPQTAALTAQSRTDPPVPLTGYGAIVAADNPVAYWRLDETNGTLAEDAVGTFDGTYTPGTGAITYGVSSGIPHTTDAAITLAGGATIQVLWAPELNPDTGWTLESWLNPTTLSQNGGDYRVVFSSEYNDQSAGFPYNGWYLYQQPANNFAFVPQPANAFIDAGPNDPANNNQLVAGKWYHLVITDDLNNFNIYINGVLITSFPVAGVDFIPNGDGINPDGLAALNSVDGADDNANFVFGQRDDFAFGTFLGSVDDTAIYNYALSPQQVAGHYAAAAGLTINSSAGNATLSFPAGTLQSTTDLTVPFANVPGATSPYTVPLNANGAIFYRVKVP